MEVEGESDSDDSSEMGTAQQVDDATNAKLERDLIADAMQHIYHIDDNDPDMNDKFMTVISDMNTAYYLNAKVSPLESDDMLLSPPRAAYKIGAPHVSEVYSPKNG